MDVQMIILVTVAVSAIIILLATALHIFKLSNNATETNIEVAIGRNGFHVKSKQKNKALINTYQDLILKISFII